MKMIYLLVVLFAFGSAEAKPGFTYKGRVGASISQYGCAVQTGGGDFVNWADVQYCAEIIKPGFTYKGRTDFNISQYGCAIQTSGGDFVDWVALSYCAGIIKPGFIYKGRAANNISQYGCSIQTNGGDFVDWTDLSYCENGAQSATAAALPLDQINQLLQPQQGSQVILAADLAIPGNQGCGSAQEAKGGVQCYICQSKKITNGTLYTNQSVLEMTTARMLESRAEIQVDLVNSDELNMIRCLSKKKITINVTSFGDLTKMLEDSGIQFKDPGMVVKTLGKTQP